MQTMQSHNNAMQVDGRKPSLRNITMQHRWRKGLRNMAFGEKIKNCLKNPELFFLRSFDTMSRRSNSGHFEITTIHRPERCFGNTNI